MNYTAMRSIAMAVVISATGLSCGEDGGSSVELQFEGEQAFLPGFEQDTGFIPADSPAAIRMVARGQGGVVARARATGSGSSLEPIAGSGELTSNGELLLEVSARIDTAGFQFEGVVDSFSYTIEPATTTFEPFLLDSSASVEAALPAAELARVPVPSVPGATLIVDVTGGTVTTSFQGVCAEVADGVAQYTGRTTTTGVVELGGTIEIEIPIVGTETFGPFPISVDIPALESGLDLGSRSLSNGEPVEGAMPCEGGGASGTGGPESGPSTTMDPGTGSSAGPTTASTMTMTMTTMGTTGPTTTTSPPTTTTSVDESSTGMGTGDLCMDVGFEPNDNTVEAEFLDRDPPFDCDGFQISAPGTLDGPDDEDWFAIPSADTDATGCNHYANIDIPDARVCVFVECPVGDSPTSSCVEGTLESVDGIPGCCSNTSAGTLQIECSAGASTAVTTYVRVDQGSVCENYNAVYQHDPA